LSNCFCDSQLADIFASAKAHVDLSEHGAALRAVGISRTAKGVHSFPLMSWCGFGCWERRRERLTPDRGETTAVCWLDAQHESAVSGAPEIPRTYMFIDTRIKKEPFRLTFFATLCKRSVRKEESRK